MRWRIGSYSLPQTAFPRSPSSGLSYARKAAYVVLSFGKSRCRPVLHPHAYQQDTASHSASGKDVRASRAREPASLGRGCQGDPVFLC